MASRTGFSITQLSKRMFSSRPPRPRPLLMRIPWSVPFETMLLATTFRMPPAVSLPSTTAPCARRTVQLVMVTFSVGRPTLLPSASLPDLMQIASSPVSKYESEMRTSRLESTSMPSVLAPGKVSTITFRTTTFSQ